MTDADRHSLDEDGYLVLEGFMGLDLLAALRRRVVELFAEEGGRAGAEFKQEPGCRRLANLVDKGDVFRQAILRPRLLECVGHVLGPEFKLSSLNVRSVDPHSDDAQPLHADMAAIADERGHWVCNAVWMLDDFTRDNGAIRVVPGSHYWRRLPQDALIDPKAPHPDERLLMGPAGTVVVMNAHAWHGGTANRTAAPRTAMHSFFARSDKPQQQYQKQLLRPEVQRELPPELRRLLALDDPLNDKISAEVAVRSGFLK
ncbi:MAG: phytanoyl-CoA dioxygenase family protein [Gemmataceae bacterium]|nr:phytanoyl-CoA dioxygenase family protein [Gemmataceae bacterium]